MEKRNEENKQSAASSKKTVERKTEMLVGDKFAIFETGGKQYQAVEGKTLAIEKIEGDAGATLEFDKVLLRKLSDEKIEIGQPHLKGNIKASIVKQMKGPKKIVFRFKRRKKVRVKRGHRQPMTVIRIETI